MGEKPTELEAAAAGTPATTERPFTFGSKAGQSRGGHSNLGASDRSAATGQSNIEGDASPGGKGGDPAEGIITSTRSNTFREGVAGDEGGEPAEGSNLNSSKSNAVREGVAGDEGGEPAEGSNLN